MIGAEKLRFPASEVGLFGKLAFRSQLVQNFAVGRALIEIGRIEVPDLAIGGVVEGEPLAAIEDGDRRRQLVEDAPIGFDVALGLLTQRLGLGNVERDAGGALRGRQIS